MFLLALSGCFAGCAAILGWDIHAPGVLSANFTNQIQTSPARIGLYIPPEVYPYQSKDRGSRTADPQTFHIGEAYAPMLVEGFQSAFEEFIFLETEPTSGILRQYAIPHLAVVRIKGFKNRVTWKGQSVSLVTETAVFDTNMNKLARCESRGTSDAQKVFAKKGGPEVNLNAAIENNVLAIVSYLQDSLRTGQWR